MGTAVITPVMMQSRSVDEYQIGIICALAKELRAVRAIFDEEHESRKSKHAQDQNSYVLGQIGHHLVVAAGLPDGVYGTTSAATVAKDMLRTFPSIRFGLLVGIGGGIPHIKAKQDIRLGDVVVSRPSGTHGGVVQYDMGESLNNGRFERKGASSKPPQSLLTALTKLKASLNGNLIAIHLRDIDQKCPTLKPEGYSHQGVERDLLRCISCDPAQWWWVLWVLLTWFWPLWRCADCMNGVVKRPPRAHLGPVVHYGTIASGNTLLKDGKKRDQLRQDLGALCVEMEAAGLDNYPCLVIRGICDYADMWKNDVWQEYAALTAAALAKELLEHVSPEAASGEQPVCQILGQLHQHFQRQEHHWVQHNEYYRRKELRYQDDRHRDCHRMLKTSDYESQKNINPRAVPGTCEWVLGHPRYQSWSNSTTNDLLWISADPGCGKSVLSRGVIDGSLGLPIICYFFFKDNDQQNNLATALCAILHQLFSYQPDLICHALPAFERSGEKLQDDTHNLWRVLQSAMSDVRARSIICVLDALDECRDMDRAQLIGRLCDSYNHSQNPNIDGRGVLKWLVTSRPYDNVRDHFNNIDVELPSIRLRGEEESDQIRDEINLVIRERMKTLSRKLGLSEDKTSEVTKQLLEMEHRTYLWLHLAIDAIESSFRKTLRPSEKVVPLVPKSVEDAYERLLGRVVDTTEREHARRVLTIIVGARRPLTLQEMAFAFDLATLPPLSTKLSDLIIDADELGDRVRQWCGLFVSVNHGRLYLLHQTAKEFLLAHGRLELDTNGWKHTFCVVDVEREMARICISFLCLPEFNDDSSAKLVKRPMIDGSVSQDRQYPGALTFFEFAAEHWASYTKTTESHLDGATSKAVEALYDTSSVRYTLWTEIASKRTYRGCSLKPGNDIRWAAVNGHNKVLRRLLSRVPGMVNDKSLAGDTALMMAAHEGHIAVVQTLIDEGADLDIGTAWSGNALCIASFRGHENVVRMLLTAGSKVNDTGGCLKGQTALPNAAIQGHVQVVRILLDAGADVNGNNPLAIASEAGHEKVVQMLLDAGADVNIGTDEDLPVYRASLGGHEKVVQMLLSTGADIAQLRYLDHSLQIASAKGYEKVVRVLLDAGVDGQTALGHASANGRKHIVRMLLDAGADANMPSGGKSNVLELAVKGDHEEVVQLLLDAGADAREQNGAELLDVASWGGNKKIVQMLLDAGAGANVVPEGNYSYALSTAACEGHVEVVRMLLHAGANIDAYEKDCGTALHYPSRAGHEEVVGILLSAGADVNALGGTLVGSALQCAASTGREKVVQMLLDGGADVDAQGGYNDSALAAASARGHEQVVQMLLDAGANVHVYGKKHGSALLAAAAGGHEKVVLTLLAAHADIDAPDDVHVTALEAASADGHVGLIPILIAAGADVNLERGRCGGALYMASRNGHQRTVQMLLDSGADVDAKGGVRKSVSALQAAVLNGHEQVVQVLLKAGANINAAGEGVTALQIASQKGHRKIVQMLTDAGAAANMGSK